MPPVTTGNSALDRLIEADGPGLSGLMVLDVATEELWQTGELPAIWQHQLASDLPPAARQAQVSQAGLLADALPLTFGELLSRQDPSLTALELSFVQTPQHTGVERSGTPAEIARALRCALAAAAWLRMGRFLLSRFDLAAEIDWTRSQPWLDETTGRLLDETAVAARAGSSSPEPSSKPAEADTFPALPGYEIIGRLGEGGMGVVWRARQLATGRGVALKTLRGSLFVSERARQRFGREVDLASQLEHPNIARVYDSGASNGVQFYAMELIDGLPLDRYVASKRLARRDILELMAQVCRGMQHAHERGVIHRDLKPSNIMVDRDGRPCVLDFGLAKVAEVGAGEPMASLQLSLEGELAGTVAFMAPEQARGEAADTRSDVYALGAMLFYLLTGQVPHEQSGTHWQVLQRVAQGQVPRPRQVDPTIDGELEAVLLKAMSSVPAGRYASAGELAADINRYLRGEPLLARPPTLAYYADRWVRQRRTPLALATAVAVALLATAVWSYVRVTMARNEALAAQSREQAARKLAEQQKSLSESARRDAERSAAQALADRQKAEQSARTAEMRLADSLIAQGDAMAIGSRWVEAKQLYRQAGQSLTAIGASAEEADLGLVPAYRVAPPPLMTFNSGHGAVRATALSPDNRFAASSAADSTITLWDVPTGRELRTLTGHGQPVKCLAFAPDGKLLLSVSTDGSARLWDRTTGQTLHEMPFSGGDQKSGCFSPDGKLCGVANELDVSTVWDVSSGKPAAQPTMKGRMPPLALAFTPDSKRCLLAGRGGEMRLFNLESGQVDREIPIPRGVASAAFSADGRYLLLGFGVDSGRAASLALWDTRTWQLIRNLPGHTGEVQALLFSPDGKLAYSASNDGTIKTWDLERLVDVRTSWGDETPLEHACISPDGAFALSGGADGVVKLWDLNADRGVVSAECHDAFRSAAISPDGRLALVGTSSTLSLIDLETGQRLAKADIGGIDSLAISPDDTKGLFITHEGTAQLFDLADMNQPGFPQRNLAQSLFDPRGAAFSSDGKRALAAGGSNIGIYDVNTGNPALQFRSNWTLQWGICLSQDDRSIFAATSHGVAEAWDAGTGTPKLRLGWAKDRRELEGNASFSSDGMIAAAGSGGRILTWDASFGKLLGVAEAHRGSVLATAISSDDRWLVTGGTDGLLKLWELKPLREVRTLAVEDDPVQAACFTADNRRVISFDRSGRLTVFDLDRPLRDREFRARLDEAGESNDPGTLKLLGKWYAFRGRWDWAAELLQEARREGADVSPLMLARCRWLAGDRVGAQREFAAAKERNEASAPYLDLCIQAVSSNGDH